MKLTKEILTNSKWRVTPEQSKRLQEAAFELGFNIMHDSHLSDRWLIFGLFGNVWSSGDIIGVNDYIERKFEDYFEELDKSIELGYSIPAPKYTFMWAVEQMKQGKKLIGYGTSKDSYIYIKNESSIYYHSYCSETNEEDNPYSFSIGAFEAIDWEIYEENKFGDFEVRDNGEYIEATLGIDNVCIDKFEFDNLEKAIKRARELNG